MSVTGNNPSYIIAAASTTNTTAINGGYEPPTLHDIKIICTARKKRTKRHIYLTFVESCSLTSTDEEPCIEIRGKTNSSSRLLSESISFEYFDTNRNDFQSFVYIYFQSYTISIDFTDENILKKPLIIKHLEHMYQKRIEKASETNYQLSQELPHLATTDHILHAFDVKLIPYDTIISRDHILIGPVRLYFTTTDLYIASIDCNRMDLKTTIANQCPSKDKTILCIPYFTIRHYGNRSHIFLIELGKSNYGNGEIHMKCQSSSLASTIHLLVSPVIEERPLALSSAFQQLLTHRRMEKSKAIQPPIQLTHDASSPPILASLLPFNRKPSIESLPSEPTKVNEVKRRSVVGLFRKFVKKPKTLQRSCTFNTNQDHMNEQSNILPLPMNKFFELNIEDKKFPNNPPQTINALSELVNNKTTETPPLTSSVINQETTDGTYIDMGPTVPKSDQTQQEEVKDEETIKETTATVDAGINTTISIPPHIHSAIIVGTTIHFIAEERAVFPIGQRSFTSPASVMQPFKAQLTGQTTINTYPTSTDMATCAPNSSSSFHHPTSASNSQQSLFLSYGIVTFNNNPSPTDQPERASSPLSNGSNVNLRLNSDLSLMSVSHQQQPSNIYSLDNILSSSSNSHIFRTLSLSTNNIGDNTSRGNIIFFDENFTDQTTNYLIGPPPPPSSSTDETNQTNLPRLSSLNLTTSISRSHINQEKIPSNDPYALIEPLSLHNSPLPSVSIVVAKPLLPSDKSTNYTDLLIPSNTGDDQQELNSTDDDIEQYNSLLEEKNERSSTILYTDIDFHQTQRRDRIAQFAAISKSEDQTPPFVL